MNIVTGFARRRLAGAAILAGLLASACVPIRLEASWPALSLVGDTQNIAVAYKDRVVLVNPEDGAPVALRNADGEVRLDEEGRARIWQFTAPEGTITEFYASPVVLNDTTLLVPAYNRRMFEVDLQTARADGDLDGVEMPGHVLSTPVLNENLFYVGFTESDLVALNATDQAERWRVDTEQGIWAAPLLADNVLYFTSLDHYLYAVNAESGEELWRLDLQGAAPSTPVLYNGRLYIGSFARKLFEVSLEGEIVSEFATNEWVWGAPAIVDDVVYVGDLNGTVYALSIGSGGFRELWQAQVSEMAIRTTPLVAGEYVIVGSRDHRVYWLNREDGSTFFFREAGGEVLSELLLIEPSEDVVIDEPLVVVGTPTIEQVLVAFTLQSGEQIWAYGFS